MNTYNDEERISAALSRYAASKIPTGKNLWPAIRQRVSPTSHPHLGFAAAGLALLTLLLVAVAGYSLLSTPAATNYTSAVVTTPAITQSDPNGLISDAIYPLLTPLNLSQTQNGITVTVRSAYADANVIAVSYDVESSTPDLLVPWHTDVVVLEKMVYHTFNTQPQLGSNTSGNPANPIQLAKVRHFVTYYVADPTYSETLSSTFATLTVESSFDLERRQTQSMDKSGGSSQASQNPNTVASFGFRFHVPFQPNRRIATINQTIAANGVTITIDSLVVTPGAAEVMFQLKQPETDADTQWFPTTMYANVGGMQAQVSGGRDVGRASVAIMLASLYNAKGAWTVTVPTMSRLVPSDNAQEVLNGPWVFNFAVPPAP